MKQNNLEIISNTSQICVGEYEILFSSTADGEKGIQYINNALINPNFKLSYKLNWNKDRTSLDSVDFTMPNDEGKLGDFFATLPYGLLKKNRTGIGATTLELKSRRNSIVVVPTRALAFEKAKQSRITNNKYKVLYVGGRIEGFYVPTIEEYIADIDIVYKKFIVVIDSLPTLLNVITEEHYRDYFIMFDEIDSYQYDSHYRPKMESAFSYYFRFPKTQRCLVSATIGTFSNPLINAEPIINITFNNFSPRNIKIQHTDNILISTKNLIEERLITNPNEKILIAFNLVTRGILPIIKSLSEDIQAKCSVLCSSKIKNDVGEFYREITSSELPTQITFMSCTYFVGIDIKERFHLISCCDVIYPFTLLSTDKLQQIAGRCRNEEGLLSETIVYNTVGEIPRNPNLDLDNIRKTACNDAQLLVDISQNIHLAKQRFPTLFYGNRDINNSDLVSYSSKKYGQSSKINTVFDHERKLYIAYFNIDHIIIQLSLMQSLYAEQSILPSRLREQGNIVEIAPIVANTGHIEEEIINNIQESIFQTREEERNNFIEQLRAKSSIEDRRILAEGLRTNCSRGNTLFLEHFIELQEYVPFEQLIASLQKWDNPRTYNDFFHSVIIWSLHEEHPIRLLINGLFEIGKSYTGEEMKQKINEIWLSLGYGSLSNRQSLPKRSLFCTSKITSRRDNNGNPERVYKIIDLNPLRFLGSSINPITQSNTPQLRRLFKF